jgi:hypothetical protein
MPGHDPRRREDKPSRVPAAVQRETFAEVVCVTIPGLQRIIPRFRAPCCAAPGIRLAYVPDAKSFGGGLMI